MPIEINWDNDEKTVLIMRFVSPWTWEEAYQATNQAFQMIDVVDHSVDAILDWSQSTRLPVNALSNARYLSRQRHPQAGITVACGANSALTALWTIFARLYSVMGIEPRYQLVDTLEQARDKLAQIQLKRYGVGV